MKQRSATFWHIIQIPDSQSLFLPLNALWLEETDWHIIQIPDSQSLLLPLKALEEKQQIPIL